MESRKPASFPLGLANCVQQRAGDGIFGRTATPNDELKGRVVSLALGHGQIHHVSDGFAIDRALKSDGMAEHGNAFFHPNREVAHPQPFIQLGQEFVDLAHQLGLDAHIEGAAEMQRTQVI